LWQRASVLVIMLADPPGGRCRTGTSQDDSADNYRHHGYPAPPA
jgi:hypothetical protein